MFGIGRKLVPTATGKHRRLPARWALEFDNSSMVFSRSVRVPTLMLVVTEDQQQENRSVPVTQAILSSCPIEVPSGTHS